MRWKNTLPTLWLLFSLLLATFQPAALASPSDRAAAPAAGPIPSRASSGPAVTAQEGIPIRLRAGAFDPLGGEPAIPTGMRRTLTAGQPGLRLIQFPGPIQDEWYQAMLAAGLEVVTYIPDYAYLVWGDGDAVARLADAAPLRWAGFYHPYYALHPALADPEKLPDEVDVIVQVYARPDAEKTVQAILGEALATFRRPYKVLVYTNLGIRVPSQKLTWLASLPEVVNVEPYTRPVLLDEIQGQIMAGNLNAAGTQPSGPGYLAWLQSRGFSTNPDDYPIIDITDDGIDDGDATPIHADFYVLGSTSNPDRLVYNYNWTTDPLADGGAGTGTSTRPSPLATTTGPASPTRTATATTTAWASTPSVGWLAPRCSITLGWDTTATPTDLLNNSYALGGRISSNSWGYTWSGGDYNADSQEYDARVRDAQPSVPGNQEISSSLLLATTAHPATPSARPVLPKTSSLWARRRTTAPPGPTAAVWVLPAPIVPRTSPTSPAAAPATTAGSSRTLWPRARISRVRPRIAPGYNGSGVCDQYMPAGQTLYAASSGTSHSTPAVAGAASLVYYLVPDPLRQRSAAQPGDGQGLSDQRHPLYDRNVRGGQSPLQLPGLRRGLPGDGL
jgi:hypothetical protein